MVQHILRHSKGLRDHKIMHPEREWIIGLGIGLIIFTATAYHSAFTYWKDKHMTSSSEAVTAQPIVVYRGVMVKDALTRFDMRNRERDELIGSFSGKTPSPAPAAPTVATTTASSTTVIEKVATTTVSNSGI